MHFLSMKYTVFSNSLTIFIPPLDVACRFSLVFLGKNHSLHRVLPNTEGYDLGMSFQRFIKNKPPLVNAKGGLMKFNQKTL